MTRIILLLILSVSFKISAQDLFKEGTINHKNHLEVVDFEIFKGKIIIPVSINNKPYRFLLDTGAPNIISERLQKDLKLKTINESLIVDANNNKDTLKIVNLPSLNIGKLSFENNISLVSDFHNHQLLQCYDIDGFIGSNLFGNTAIKISLKEKKLYITDKVKNLNPKTKGIKLQLIGSQLAPYINIDLEGKNGEKGSEDVLIDTGMDGIYDISNRAFSVSRSKEIYSQENSDIGSGSVGLFGNTEEQEQYQVIIPKIKINKATLANVSAYTMNDNNSRIGLKLLEYGDIILDFKKKKFYFENTSEIQSENPTKLEFTVEENTYMIGFVWDEKLKEQIRYGDKVLRIDHLNIKEMEVCEMLTIKEYLKDKSSYEIEILNQNNETKIIEIK